MKLKTLAILGVAILVAVSAGATESTRWINVHVTEARDGTNVEVHLPLNLVLTVIENIKVDHFDRGVVDLDMDCDADIDWPEVIKAVRTAPDGEYVKVVSDDADVQVRKDRGLMLVNVTEKRHDRAKVNVSLPIEILDAFQVDDQNRLDVKTLLAAIDQLPNGELVRVESDDANVRVWVE